MKKFSFLDLFLILASIFFISHIIYNIKNNLDKKQKQEILSTNNSFINISDHYYQIKTYTHENHKYVVVKTDNSAISIVHSFDCDCLKTNK